jgi:superfamily II DNA or RNA helicase
MLQERCRRKIKDGQEKKRKKCLENYDIFIFTVHVFHWREMTSFIKRKQLHLHTGRRADTKRLASLQSDMAWKKGLECEGV